MKIYLCTDSALQTLFTEEPLAASSAIEVTPEEWVAFSALSQMYWDKVREFEKRAGWTNLT